MSEPTHRRRAIKDPEIRAMRDCWTLLAPFDNATRSRMLRWLADYNLGQRELPAIEGNHAQ